MAKITKADYRHDKYWDEDIELRALCANMEYEPGMKTLDVGCLDSYIDNALTVNGCEAWGVDLRNWHAPNFKFIQGDFNEVELPENYFDVIFEIGALHHFGVGYLREGGISEDMDADIKAAKKISRLLKPDGIFHISTDMVGPVLAVNFGDGGYRINTWEELNRRILSHFDIIETKFYNRHKHGLVEIATAEEAEQEWAQFYIKARKKEEQK